MVKPRSKQVSQKKLSVDDEKLEKLTERLVDKPYGQSAVKPLQEEDVEVERITISIPRSMRHRMEDLARQRKRAKEPNRSVSAIVRVALEHYFKELDEV